MSTPNAIGEARDLLHELFDAAVTAASASACLPPYLPGPVSGRTLVVGAGKAAAAMAAAFEEHFAGDSEGVVVVPDGHATRLRHIRLLTSSHPVPDERSVAASRAMLELVAGVTATDQVVCLISGGGSSAMCLPAPGVSLADKQALSKALLACGARISEINCVRKHISLIKGGRLAAACHPAPCLTLAISDVPGDDPALIASGPTVGDPSTRLQALRILERYGLRGHASVVAWLSREESETPKPEDPRLAASSFVRVANAAGALAAASHRASFLGLEAIVLGDDLEGEARDLAQRHAQQVRRMLETGIERPHLLLSGGESTVTVTGHGRGGRNSEYLLALAIELDSLPGVYALACDTDGIDGNGDNAGAIIGPAILERARAAGIDARAHLSDNDAYHFFKTLDRLIVTGPTLTNVNDFRAILVLPRRGTS